MMMKEMLLLSESKQLWKNQTISGMICPFLNSLYGELCWDNDDPLEFIPDYENDQIIVRRKKWNLKNG